MPAEKSQLNNSWCFWYEARPETVEEGTEWGSQQKNLYTFSSVEDFWCVYNNILPARKLNSNCMYHFFKADIKPSWEDEHNENGGSWRFSVRPNDSILDEKWMTLLLSIVGETLDPTGCSVCGVSMIMKNKAARVEVWLKNSDDQSAVATVGRRIRSMNVVEKKEKIEFRKHGGETLYLL